MVDRRIAIIADAHFHALEADWGFDGAEGIAPRSWSDTVASTRIFNESHAALFAALDDIVARGITDVVLLGDYSDDGQPITVRALGQILDQYSEAKGLRFFALPGNHDVFGPLGRHRTKEFLRADGAPVTLTSDPDLVGANYVPEMRCDAVADGIPLMARFGFLNRSDMLHFETPFGTSDAFSDRYYTVSANDGKTTLSLLDASYLVEPQPGLWMLMLDANVFVPTGNGQEIIDSTNAGWTALLAAKPFLIDWISDVVARAQAQGKQVLAFSHYPVLDPFEDDEQDDVAMFGQTAMVRRTPAPVVSEALSKAGIHLHFSGHLHVKRTTDKATQHGQLTNVAVPSLAAFPSAYLIVEISEASCTFSDVPLDQVVPDPRVQRAYRMECGNELPPAATASETYRDFLIAHCRALVWHRYVPREWPTSRAAEIEGATLKDLLWTMRGKIQLPPELEEVADLTLREVIEDWYLLRMGGPLARSAVNSNRSDSYLECARFLTIHFHAKPETEFWGRFFKRLGDFVSQAQKATPVVRWPCPTARGPVAAGKV